MQVIDNESGVKNWRHDAQWEWRQRKWGTDRCKM